MACGPFFVVLEIFECPLNVGRLLSSVAPAEEQYANSPEHHVIDPVAGPQLIRNSLKPWRNGLQSPKFPAASRLIRLAIFACARASASRDNQSSNTSFPARST